MRGPAAFALLLAGVLPWLIPVSDTHAATSPIATAAGDDDDDDEEGRPKGPRLAPGQNLGLVLTVSRGDTVDARPARLVALAVPEGTPPSAFLAPGPFHATWEGNLAIPFRSEFDFVAAGRGKIKVEVNGKVALEGSGDDLSKLKGKTAKLKKGANVLVVTYDSPDKGDADVRLSWSSEDFGREPISPSILSHDAATARLVEGNRLREGRDLLANLRCLKCHTAPAATPSAGSMPELALDAPNLDDAGARLRTGWMARWIDDPRSLRPTATMPRMFHGQPAIAPGSDLATAPAPSDPARDLAAYLATLGGGKADAAGTRPAAAETVAAGGRLFAGLGCVGCHTLPDRADWAADANRVPLRFVGAKWQPEALRAFLLQPNKHYAWIRMPNFHLSGDEADKLAAYVSSGPATDLTPAAAADPTRGKALFASSGCANCHAAKPSPGETAPAPALATIPADGWARGCLDPATAPTRKAPDFGLADGPRQALKVFATAASAPASLARDAAPEFAERQIKALRCASCHKRDGYDDAWTELQPEVANLAADANAGAVEMDPDGHPYPALQARPPLTWIGEKLKPEWAASFIAGKLDYKPRPYLKARMPAFAMRAEGLAEGLALEHGYAATSAPDPAPDLALVPDAKALVRSTGLNCVSCHKVGNVAAVGVFEAPGINFMHVKERLRKDYYDRWIRSPMRVDPDTKMPSFFNGEASVLPTILEGRAQKQAEALWNYLLQGRAIEAPGS